MAVELLLFGDVRARVDGRPVDLGHARQRCVLAALLVDANRIVPADRLLERVWGEHRPRHARNALAGYVSRLRTLLGGSGGFAITHRSDGYLLTVEPDAVDLHRFRRLLARARSPPAPKARTPAAEPRRRGSTAKPRRRCSKRRCRSAGASPSAPSTRPGWPGSVPRSRPSGWLPNSTWPISPWPPAGMPNSSASWPGAPPGTRSTSGSPGR
ncbi:hypothetical protein GCM10027615_78550 [Plantactinospora veratri]